MSEAAKNLFKNIVKAENTQVEFDLDNWIADFENGFLDYEKTNPLYKPGYWGQGIANRPRIRELNIEADAQINQGYRVIEFFPDRDNKDDSYLFFGTPSEIRMQVATFMNFSVMLRNVDIGAFLGYPLDEYLRAEPRTGITIQVVLTYKKQPPFNLKSTTLTPQHWVTIPLVDKSLISYSALRNACGGDAGQNWGEWSARAYLSSDDSPKGIRQMVARGATETLAKKNLKAFLKFTTCKTIRITANRIDYDEGNDVKNPNKAKLSSYEVYPGWISVWNSKLIAISATTKGGTPTASGKKIGKRSKLFIYMKKEPTGWLAQFNEVSKDPK